MHGVGVLALRFHWFKMRIIFDQCNATDRCIEETGKYHFVEDEYVEKDSFVCLCSAPYRFGWLRRILQECATTPCHCASFRGTVPKE